MTAPALLVRGTGLRPSRRYRGRADTGGRRAAPARPRRHRRAPDRRRHDGAGAGRRDPVGRPCRPRGQRVLRVRPRVSGHLRGLATARLALIHPEEDVELDHEMAAAHGPADVVAETRGRHLTVVVGGTWTARLRGLVRLPGGGRRLAFASLVAAAPVLSSEDAEPERTEADRAASRFRIVDPGCAGSVPASLIISAPPAARCPRGPAEAVLVPSQLRLREKPASARPWVQPVDLPTSPKSAAAGAETGP